MLSISSREAFLREYFTEEACSRFENQGNASDRRISDLKPSALLQKAYWESEMDTVKNRIIKNITTRIVSLGEYALRTVTVTRPKADVLHDLESGMSSRIKMTADRHVQELHILWEQGVPMSEILQRPDPYKIIGLDPENEYKHPQLAELTPNYKEQMRVLQKLRFNSNKKVLEKKEANNKVQEFLVSDSNAMKLYKYVRSLPENDPLAIEMGAVQRESEEWNDFLGKCYKRYQEA